MKHWPRIVEILLGCWLSLSPAFLGWANGNPATLLSERFFGSAIIIVAIVAIVLPWEPLHFLIAPLDLWILIVPYFEFARPGPALAQSDITVGLVLLMMLILPTRALEPPKSWRVFRDAGHRAG